MVSTRIGRGGPLLVALLTLTGASPIGQTPGGQTKKAPAAFSLQEATIPQIQQAIRAGRLTSVGLVELYLKRIKAYNGTCVNQPQGILGPITTIPHAGQLNALSTLNLRPAARRTWGFDDRKARSLTDPADNAASMPDALEVAAEQDRSFKRTGRLVGPLHGVVMAIKDQYDTFDMRTTSGADVQYANDRPPDDATFVKRLRDAGAILIAKANMAEYATDGGRSAFGGTFCNPYDTERVPGMSSAGSGTSVAANLVTCAIAEETVVSIRWPSAVNNVVGLAGTQELVSRDGMMGAGLNTRTGPICRTVQDAARIFDVIAGWDPKDELTAFSVGRMPAKSYASAAVAGPLTGVHIGVVREYMDKKLFAKADEESIDLVERAIADVRKLGAAIVDPGPGGSLLQACLNRYAPQWYNAAFAAQRPALFTSPSGQIATLLQLDADPGKVPDGLSIRNFGVLPAQGEAKYMIDKYLRERGDANIKTNADLISKATFYNDSNFPDRRQQREAIERQTTFETAARMQSRFAMQTIVLECMQEQRLDAMMSPTATVPAPKLNGPREPNVNGRPAIGWSLLGQQGFPVMSVPAGFTTSVWDRVRDGNEVRLAGPIPAKLPVGVDFIGRPFGEPMLFRIGAAYEAATRHRTPPPEFGPVPGEP
jgi:Asp-tRNA(Asn)/Glu-tRNA(Gln) amidotransferase A subunit family amidase